MTRMNRPKAMVSSEFMRHYGWQAPFRPAVYGILNHREHYLEENHLPTARSERLEAAGVVSPKN